MSSDVLLRLEAAAASRKSRGVSLAVHPGDAWALLGTSQRDVDELYGCIVAGSVQRGTIERSAAASSTARSARVAARTTMGSAFNRFDGVASAKALTALRLWEELGREVGTLDEEETVAFQLAYLLSQPGPLHFLGRWPDPLGPWRLDGLFALMEELLGEGHAVIVATNRAAIAERLGNVVVLKGGDPVFAGSVADLIAQARPSELVVETDEPAAVAAMAAPFTMRVTVLPGELHIQAADGQALAARLLTEGYGHIRSVVVRAPTLDDALLQAT